MLASAVLFAVLALIVFVLWSLRVEGRVRRDGDILLSPTSQDVYETLHARFAAEIARAALAGRRPRGAAPARPVGRAAAAAVGPGRSAPARALGHAARDPAAGLPLEADEGRPLTLPSDP